MIISFSGLDGCGKSTHVRETQRWLKQQGVEVRIIETHALTTYHVIGQVLRRISEGQTNRLLNEQYAHIPEATRNGKWKLLGIVRSLAFLVDLVFFLILVWIPARMRSREIILCDRYLWDTAVQLRYLGLCGDKFFRKVVNLIPMPEAPFLLSTSAEQAYSRKPEYPLLHLKRKSQLYSDLTVIRPGIMLVESTTIKETQVAIQRNLASILDDDGIAVPSLL